MKEENPLLERIIRGIQSEYGVKLKEVQIEGRQRFLVSDRLDWPMGEVTSDKKFFGETELRTKILRLPPRDV